MRQRRSAAVPRFFIFGPRKCRICRFILNLGFRGSLSFRFGLTRMGRAHLRL